MLSEYRSAATRTHGLSGTKVHKAWKHLKDRCLNPKNKSYANYGGRGVKVCKRWLSFENFYKDMGQPPSPKHSIDRVNNNKGYCKSNCRWATNYQQVNNARSNIRVKFRGEFGTLSQLSVLFRINYNTLYQRYVTANWSIEKALTQPIRTKNVKR
jgi:hypothetical protein